MIGVLEFAAAHLGRRVAAPGGIGGQCVDLANLWLISTGGSAVRANAADWPRHAIPGWRWVGNAPANSPPAGAIVVWKANVPVLSVGPYAHIAVAIAADAWTLVTLDQDWPRDAPVALVVHDYTGVAGWFTR